MATRPRHQVQTLFSYACAAGSPSSTRSFTRHGLNRFLIRHGHTSSTTAESTLSSLPDTSVDSGGKRQTRVNLTKQNGFRREGDAVSHYRQASAAHTSSRYGRLERNNESDNYNRDMDDERRSRGGKKRGIKSNRTHLKVLYPASPDPDLHPTLYRVFFRSLDNIRTLEEAQVFISQVKSTYGPLLQYQFSRCPETKRYLGYGFMTFQEKAHMVKLLRDGYLRVMQKDFEFQRCGMLDKPTLHYNQSGFSVFKSDSHHSAPLSPESIHTTPASSTITAPSEGAESTTRSTTATEEPILDAAASEKHVENGTTTSHIEASSHSSTTAPSSQDSTTASTSTLSKQRVQLWKAAAHQTPIDE